MPDSPITRTEVEDFLRMFRAATEYGPGLELMPREKNLQGLIDLGLTIGGMKDILAELSADNYCSGPEPDDTDSKKEVWKFGYQLEGTEVYIKLRLVPHSGKLHVHIPCVWSFHPAERKLRYPLRK